MKRGRKRGFQQGSVFEHCGKWYGRWRNYSPTGKPKPKTQIIGYVDEMDEQEAKRLLLRIIQIEGHQRDSFDSLIESARFLDPIKFKREFKNRANHINGVIAEMIVSADLLARGYEVCRPISQFATFDLLYMDDLRAVRVEVKACAVSANGIPQCDLSRNAGKFDVLAIVLPTGEVDYRTPLGLKGIPGKQISDSQPVPLVCTTGQ